MLTSFAYSGIGGREKNEDFTGTAKRKNGGLFAVADGLGGHKHGETASRLVVDALLRCEINGPKDMEAAFLHAQNALLRAHAKFPGARTTAVLLSAIGNTAFWGHVGDARLYYFSGGRLTAFTADHTVAYKKYACGEIGHNDIASDEDRSSLLNVMGGEICRPAIGSEVSLSDGDAFLLCSDGFWEYLRDEELLIDLLKSDTPRRWAEYLLLRHIRRAPAGNDNFSLLTVFVKGIGHA
ncbi:MAG: protein phosphatase 2C domain-containing protein [Clostridiales Family XIII bacterium]|jgi:serine/threonine protein phosphatase PrpC|nr:protein phosphatase 2C domain-containing protein [Clostridiales Family XIII bacterium]